MQKREFLKTLGVAALGGAAASIVQAKDESRHQAIPAKPNALERIFSRGSIRAAYVVLPPEMEKDPNTGKLSGIAYELTEALGRRLNLKIEWVEEVSFATMHEGLNLGRFDMICFTLYRRANLGRVMNFTKPLFYSGNGIFVRKGEAAHYKNLNRINSEDVRIGYLDGEVSYELAREYFPNAKTLSLPMGGDLAQLLMNVILGKTDVALVNQAAASLFIAKHPNLLVNLAAERPLAVYSHGFGLPKEQNDLEYLINLGLDELIENGLVANVLAQHEPLPNSYLRLQSPYSTAVV